MSKNELATADLALVSLVAGLPAQRKLWQPLEAGAGDDEIRAVLEQIGSSYRTNLFKPVPCRLDIDRLMFWYGNLGIDPGNMRPLAPTLEGPALITAIRRLLSIPPAAAGVAAGDEARAPMLDALRLMLEKGPAIGPLRGAAATDKAIRGAISSDVGLNGRTSSDSGALCTMMTSPRLAFYFDKHPDGEPTLEGQALVDAVREVFEIGQVGGGETGMELQLPEAYEAVNIAEHGESAMIADSEPLDGDAPLRFDYSGLDDQTAEVEADFIASDADGEDADSANIADLALDLSHAALADGLLFNYATVGDADAANMMRSAATAIKQEFRSLFRLTLEHAIRVGQHLQVVKHRMPGHFTTWCQREFDMSERSARDLMRIAEVFGGRALPNNLPFTAFRLLAQKSTPREAREEIIKRARAGETVTVEETQRTVERHRAARKGYAQTSIFEQPGELSPCCGAQIGFAGCRKPRHGGLDDLGRCGTCGEFQPRICIACQKPIGSAAPAAEPAQEPAFAAPATEEWLKCAVRVELLFFPPDGNPAGRQTQIAMRIGDAAPRVRFVRTSVAGGGWLVYPYAIMRALEDETRRDLPQLLAAEAAKKPGPAAPSKPAVKPAKKTPSKSATRQKGAGK